MGALSPTVWLTTWFSSQPHCFLRQTNTWERTGEKVPQKLSGLFLLFAWIHFDCQCHWIHVIFMCPCNPTVFSWGNLEMTDGQSGPDHLSPQTGFVVWGNLLGQGTEEWSGSLMGRCWRLTATNPTLMFKPPKRGTAVNQQWVIVRLNLLWEMWK